MSLHEWFKPEALQGKSKIIKALQHHPTLRAGIYIVGSAVTVRGIVYLYDVTLYQGREAEGNLVSRLSVAPCILALTWGFAKLRQVDVSRWNRIPLRQGIVQSLHGIALGTGGFLLAIGIAYVFGWVSVSNWGWDVASKAEIERTALILGAQYVAVSWYEELIYRGYGLDTALAAGNSYVAIPVLTSVFALAHGPEWQGFISHSAMALTATILRLGSDSLWLPVGYHFAWNYVQTAVLGSPDGRPSLLPLHVDGPRLWVGRPGHAEPPGLVVAIAHVVVGAIYALVCWRRTRS